MTQPSVIQASGAELRAMTLADLAKVVAIIEQTDDDDSQDAEKDYQLEGGLEDQFVFELDGKVIGTTGFRKVMASDRSCWLSWTYLDNQYHGKGLGRKMLEQIIDKLKQVGCRKVFVKVSDYKEDGVEVYKKALALYKQLGFEQSLINKDFYDEGENQIILSQTLINDGEQQERATVIEEKAVIRFNGIFELAETDGAYTFSWVVKEKRSFLEKRSFSADDLRVGLQAAKEDGARKIFLTFPSNLPLIHAPLHAANFKFVGCLQDYYENGVDELHFSHTLEYLHNG